MRRDDIFKAKDMKRTLIFLALSASAIVLGCDAPPAEPTAQNPEAQALNAATPAASTAPSQAMDVKPLQKMMNQKLAGMGEHIFSVNCSKCHAFEGNAAPDLVGAGARLDQATFTDVVTNGRNEMPAHPLLTDVQKHALWAFVSTATAESAAIAKDREGEGCACGGACGGGGAGMACGGGAGKAPGAGMACGGGAGSAPGEGCGGSCGQGAAKAPGEGVGCGGSCGQGAAKAPGEGAGCGGSCGQGAGQAPGQQL